VALCPKSLNGANTLSNPCFAPTTAIPKPSGRFHQLRQPHLLSSQAGLGPTAAALICDKITEKHQALFVRLALAPVKLRRH
jgi:hypothetical protein